MVDHELMMDRSMLAGEVIRCRCGYRPYHWVYIRPPGGGRSEAHPVPRKIKKAIVELHVKSYG